ncbi:MAG TPA: hypothetical protein VFY28_01390 [Candidatus Paceibacterota bacterium]|nr:hypothetical protein [Candidatus Paceibacterota bacterium]
MRTRRKLWFRAKYIGWGWYPVSWEGWAVTLLYILLYIASGLLYGALSPSALAAGGSVGAGTALLFSWYLLLTASLLWVCYRHGEKPGWRFDWRKFLSRDEK